MKWRERWASLLLLIGVGLWLVALILIIPRRRRRRRLRSLFNPTLWKLAGILALIGGIFVLVGLIATAVIYLTRRWGYDAFTPVQQLSPAFAPIGRAR